MCSLTQWSQYAHESTDLVKVVALHVQFMLLIHQYFAQASIWPTLAKFGRTLRQPPWPGRCCLFDKLRKESGNIIWTTKQESRWEGKTEKKTRKTAMVSCFYIKNSRCEGKMATQLSSNAGGIAGDCWLKLEVIGRVADCHSIKVRQRLPARYAHSPTGSCSMFFFSLTTFLSAPHDIALGGAVYCARYTFALYIFPMSRDWLTPRDGKFRSTSDFHALDLQMSRIFKKNSDVE